MPVWKMDVPVLDFMIALVIGALIGIEREKHRAEGKPSVVTGLRTFILLAEAGALAAWIATSAHEPLIFAAAGLMVTAIVITGYLNKTRQNPEASGLTTEIAALVVFLLGGAALYGFRELAVALAIVTLGTLAYKQPLHGIVGKLDREDMTACLKLLFATFIILPVLPNLTIDPWEAINPYKMWWLVILIAALSFTGYIASRWLGTSRGTALTGFFGGLVSSTAVTLSFARSSREPGMTNRSLSDALASGILLSWFIMFIRIAVEVAIVNRTILSEVAKPMAIMGLFTGLTALAFYRRSAKGDDSTTQVVPLKNPFSLSPAIKFALFFMIVLLFVKLAEIHFHGQGIYLVSILAGMADVDAITLSMAQFARDGGDVTVAVNAIVLTVLANTAVKCGLVLALGTRGLKGKVAIGTAILTAAAVGWYFVR